MTKQITTFPVPPDSGGGRAAFVAAANQFGNDLTPFGNQLNEVAVEVNTNALAAAQSKSDAATSEQNAANSALAAQSAATANADTWVSGASYALNELVWGSATSGQLYRCILAHSGVATPPASDPTNWALVLVDPARMTAAEAAINGLLDVPVAGKTAAYTLTLADRGTCISTTANVAIPANTATAFPVGATLLIRNRNSTAITISITTDTLRLSGTTKTGTRTLAPYGTATLHKDAATVWFSSGAGLT